MNIFKHLKTLIFAACIIFIYWAGLHAETKLSVKEAGAGDSPVMIVRDSVLAYFYPVDGTITRVDRENVRVSFSTEKALKKGMRFSVFRKGKPFYHPITKELIGNSEELIGKVEIIKPLTKAKNAVKINYLCRVVRGKPEAGDIARITSSKIKLAFFQDKKADWEVSEDFYNSLKKSDRFEILETYTSSYEPLKLAEAAKGLGAEALLMFSTPAEGENMSLLVELYWAEDAKNITQINEIMDIEPVRQFTPKEEFINASISMTEPWATYEMVSSELIATGDVDGDSSNEIVVSNGRDIRIYKLEEEPREIWFIKGSGPGRHLSLDVLDLNKNGRAEIFVTSLVDSGHDADIIDSKISRERSKRRMDSFVLEYNISDGYEKVWDNTPYVFRVSGKELLMQEFRPVKVFTGPVYTGIWKDGQYMTGNTVEIPAGVNIFGFSFVDWRNNGHLQLLAFDDKGYLYLYDGDEVIWRSKESYGISGRTFESKTDSLFNTNKKWSVRGRLIPIRTEKGQEILVVKKSPIVKQVPGLGYIKAKVYSLSWDGDIMNETLILEGINGTVTDYIVDRDKLLVIANPSLLMYLKKSLSGNLKKESILYYYNMAGK